MLGGGQDALRYNNTTKKDSFSPFDQMVIRQGMRAVPNQKPSKAGSHIDSLYINARLLRAQHQELFILLKNHFRITKSPMLTLALTENDTMWENIHINDSKSDSEISSSN